MRRDPFARDVMANVLGKLWSGGVALAFAPAYVRALGIEAFGLVAVFTALRAPLLRVRPGPHHHPQP